MDHRRACRVLIWTLAAALAGGLGGSAEAGLGRPEAVIGIAPDGIGGGALPMPTDEIDEAQRARIQAAIDRNVARLRAEGRLQPLRAGGHTLFGWPLRLAHPLGDPGHHGISNFVDQNPSFPGQLLDYSCGGRTYDLSNGYNHSGTDIFTWPWSWWKMDRDEVEVVAAAPGQIVYREDGNFDRNCSFTGGNWNAVYVLHDDGSIAWYGHLKNGSLTPKAIGDLVSEGEYLGVVGSSGNSTGPHLHLEIRSASNTLIDPYVGACNFLSGDSWWTDQRDYYDSAVNRITTGTAPVVFGSCPNQEIPNASVGFGVNPTIYFTTYYRDQLSSQTSQYRLYRPNGTIYSQWTHNSNASHYSASYWYWWFSISAGEAQGTWRFTVEFEGDTHERFFTIGSPAACGRVPGFAVEGDILALEKKPAGQVRLLWGASCNPSDTDYVVYEGELGSFTSHTAATCSTAGQLEWTLTPGADGRYFLIAPRNASREGSLGRTSTGAERAEGAASCLPRLTLNCP